MEEIDLFHLFRRMLALVCCLYAMLHLIRAALRWMGADTLSGPHAVRLQRYVVTQLLRTKLRRFGWDVMQIALLSSLLFYVVSLHV